MYDALTPDGYRVAVAQNPTLSLEDGAAVTRRVIDNLDGPVVLAGHSYGGAVITEAGLHEKVAALVYVCAFAPDKGESVNTLIAGFPADGPQPPILPPQDGFSGRAAHFARWWLAIPPRSAARLFGTLADAVLAENLIHAG